MMKLSLLIQATERVTAPVRRIQRSLRGMADSGERDANRLAKAMDKVNSAGARMRSIGARSTLLVTAPLVAFGAAAFNAASDAAELQSMHDQVFGKMAGAMNRWAEQTGNAMGRSTQEMQRGAATFGMFFNQAVPPGKAAKMSATFSRLAQDLASFYNVDPGTAIDKLRSGLSGETEPLRDFGVFMTEASIKAKALKMGLKGVGGELTEQQKIMVRSAIILDSTAKAQGDVARTSGGTANQIRASKAAYEELQVTIGTKLLPKLTPLITAIGKLLDRFGQLSPRMQENIMIAGAVAAALGPLMFALGGIASGVAVVLPLLGSLGLGALKLVPTILSLGRALFVLSMNPVVLLLTAVAALAFIVWKNWDTIIAKLTAAWSGLGAFFGRMWEGIKEAFRSGVAAVWNSLPAWFRGVLTGARFAINVAGNIASRIVDVTRRQAAPDRPPMQRPRPQGAGNGSMLMRPAVYNRKGAAAPIARSQMTIKLESEKGTRARVTKLSSDSSANTFDVTRGRVAAA